MEYSKNTEIAAQFLIAEFNALQERAKNFEEIKASRVNFFLLIVAAVGAIISAVDQIRVLQQYFLESILLAAVAILLLGLSTLQHSVYYSSAIVEFYRRAGKIRHWFIDFDGTIEDHLPFEPADDRPKYYWKKNRFIEKFQLNLWRGGEPVIIIFNVISVLTIAECILLKFFYLSWIMSSMFLFLLAIATWVLQIRYVDKRMQKSEEKGKDKAHFKYEDYLKKRQKDKLDNK